MYNEPIVKSGKVSIRDWPPRKNKKKRRKKHNQKLDSTNIS